MELLGELETLGVGHNESTFSGQIAATILTVISEIDTGVQFADLLNS